MESFPSLKALVENYSNFPFYIKVTSDEFGINHEPEMNFSKVNSTCTGTPPPTLPYCLQDGLFCGPLWVIIFQIKQNSKQERVLGKHSYYFNQNLIKNDYGRRNLHKNHS